MENWFWTIFEHIKLEFTENNILIFFKHKKLEFLENYIFRNKFKKQFICKNSETIWKINEMCIQLKLIRNDAPIKALCSRSEISIQFRRNIL